MFFIDLFLFTKRLWFFIATKTNKPVLWKQETYSLLEKKQVD